MENKTGGTTPDSNDNNAASQSPRYTYSLFLKIISTFATVSGILLLMLLNTSLGIAAGVISLGIGLTLFAVSEKIKQNTPVQMKTVNSPAPT